LLAEEKTRDPFRITEPVTGAEIEGGLKAVTDRATLVEADSLSPGSVIEMASESEPV
jgi:hypothetical protein